MEELKRQRAEAYQKGDFILLSKINNKIYLLREEARKQRAKQREAEQEARQTKRAEAIAEALSI